MPPRPPDRPVEDARKDALRELVRETESRIAQLLRTRDGLEEKISQEKRLLEMLHDKLATGDSSTRQVVKKKAKPKMKGFFSAEELAGRQQRVAKKPGLKKKSPSTEEESSE
ncbi:MAG: hypothetical protein O3C40_19490 [Planctomycetota bacterium]|nr:hypothetical protein [Planctomycetota bacterium]